MTRYHAVHIDAMAPDEEGEFVKWADVQSLLAVVEAAKAIETDCEANYDTLIADSLYERLRTALITAKLLAELPRFHSLVNGRYREGDGWYVKDDNENTIYANTRDRYGPKSDTPLRALLAFHLKGTT